MIARPLILVLLLLDLVEPNQHPLVLPRIGKNSSFLPSVLMQLFTLDHFRQAMHHLDMRSIAEPDRRVASALFTVFEAMNHESNKELFGSHGPQQVLTDKQRLLLAACQQRWPEGRYNPNGNGWSDPNQLRQQLTQAVHTTQASPGEQLSWRLYHNGKPSEPQHRIELRMLPDCRTLGCLLKNKLAGSSLVSVPQTMIVDIDRFFRQNWRSGTVLFPFELNLCPFIGEGGTPSAAGCRLWLKSLVKSELADDGAKFSLVERAGDGRWFSVSAGQGHTQVSTEYVKMQTDSVCSLTYVPKPLDLDGKPAEEAPAAAAFPQCNTTGAGTLREHNTENSGMLMQCRRALTKAQSTVSELQQALAAQVATVEASRAENEMLNWQIRNLTSLLQTVLMPN